MLRKNCRYEFDNNCYARGLLVTLANDVVGTGPRLQLPNDVDAEHAFTEWAGEIGLVNKLSTLALAELRDGDGFAKLITNPRLDNIVKLDIRLIESEQVCSPSAHVFRGDGDDSGVEVDAYGNVVGYWVLGVHPADVPMGDAAVQPTLIPGNEIIHLFHCVRAGQLRGIPSLTPALPLMALLRRYTLAVVSAAETAANLAAFIKTTAPASGEAAEVEPSTELDLPRNTGLFLPEGWDLSQLKPEQPCTTYEMGKREILNEIARCLDMPYNIAACNSSGYNYASGRLDHQTYDRSICVRQSRMEFMVLDRVLRAWASEYALAENRVVNITGRDWMFVSRPHVDPGKEARAQTHYLANHTTTIKDECAKRGLDWETVLRQRGLEIKLMNELGLPVAATPAEAQTVAPEDDNE